MTRADNHKWLFKARFRRRAFGWKSQPAIRRIKEAVSEIKKVARKDARLAAEGAVGFIERISGALEQVDSSSGSIGTAVNHAIAELVPLIAGAPADAYKSWAVKALSAMGEKSEAIRYAEGCRNPWASDAEIDGLCEEILLSSGLVEEAYARYGLDANHAGTFLAWFRTVVKKYSHKKPSEILADLVEHTPGTEGKWFAAAKEANLFDEAIALANRTPCDPKTLTRAARDFATENPGFAIEAGIAALHWLVEGYGYEITSLDVLNAHSYAMKAAENAGRTEETLQRIRTLVATESSGERFVTKALGRHLGFVR